MHHQSVHQAGRHGFRRGLHAHLLRGFRVSEKITKKRGAAHAELDQFNLEPRRGPDAGKRGRAPGQRPGDGAQLQHAYQPGRGPRPRQYAPAGHRGAAPALLARAAPANTNWMPEQLFSVDEQELFTPALGLAEKRGQDHPSGGGCRPRKVGRHPARRAKPAILHHRSGTLRPSRPLAEEARIAGLAWEALARAASPHLTLEIYTPDGAGDIFYLGPHAPHLTPKEIDLLHSIWLELSTGRGAGRTAPSRHRPFRPGRAQAGTQQRGAGAGPAAAAPAPGGNSGPADAVPLIAV